MVRVSSAALLAAAWFCSAAALAQDSAPRLPPQGDQVPEKIQPDANGGSGQTLSDKLEKSDGVIKPPSGVDPEIKTIAPDPNPNSMPIIKPPGDAR